MVIVFLNELNFYFRIYFIFINYIFIYLGMKRKIGSKLLIYSKIVEMFYFRDFLVLVVVFVEFWELRVFMVFINRFFG